MSAKSCSAWRLQPNTRLAIRTVGSVAQGLAPLAVGLVLG